MIEETIVNDDQLVLDGMPEPDESVQLAALIKPFEGLVTCYKASKHVNAALKALGIDRELPPQMFYNYGRNGLLNGKKNTKAVSHAELVKWFEKYVAKNFSADSE